MHETRPVSTPPKSGWTLQDYAWFVCKNILGWIFIISSGPAGMFIPGPGGIPLFIIGFAMITFPGKRHLTARVLRGIPVSRQNRAYLWTVAAVAILLPAGLIISWLRGHWWPLADTRTANTLLLTATYLCAVIAIWSFGLLGVDVINLVLSFFPRLRRRVRPWLRRKGLDLLPPRRRKRLRHPGQKLAEPDPEILEFHESYHRRFQAIWLALKPWSIRFLRLALVAGIFFWMLRPVFKQWNDPVNGPLVRERILTTNWWLFALASLMFAAFLFAFRATSWRRILIAFGHTLPVAAATRIWSFSELARYIPGVIWQVVGRVYLSKPYGVPASVSSASQVLELCIFMLANILVAFGCLLAAGVRRIPPDHRHWLFIAAVFIPVLLTLLHPRVFYALLNKLMTRFHKPPIEPALRKRKLAVVILWNILGLLWQSLAIWVLTYSTLQLPFQKWYVLAGAYCLAWTMGFSVGFLMPGGIGVREAVFITTLQFVLPTGFIRLHFPHPAVLTALAGFLGVLLRLWAVAGELLMALLAYLSDRRPPLPNSDANPAQMENTAPHPHAHGSE